MSQPRKSFKTLKGTELPILNLRGKEYLQVAHRLVWFREMHPTGLLRTTMLAHNGEGPAEYAVFKTELFIDSERGPQMVASAHKKETRAGFDDFMEKAETGSIGRALALAGFGTQFASDELEEGDRLADAPLARVDKTEDTATISATVTNSSGVTTINGVPTKRTSFRKSVTPVAVSTTSNGAGDDI